VSDINNTLQERGSRYGAFTGHADITQSIKQMMLERPTTNWHSLSDAHKEALEMIAHKIGRILNGDPNYKDNWHDIAGYAKLAEDACKDETQNL
jgi:hypothetical protein